MNQENRRMAVMNQENRQPIIEVRNASFAFDKKGNHHKTEVFSDISFDIFENETVAVVGENGAGKTTLMRCLLGLLPLKSGEIRIDQKDIQKLTQKSLYGVLSYVPQKPLFVPGCTVTEEVLLGLSAEVGLFGAPSEEALAKVRETLELLGISELSNRSCDELSGGEFRMVYIARAIISSPKVLVLDEPESGLDFKNRLTVMETLKKLKDKGVTTVFNSHFLDDALQFSDRVILLDDGHAEVGPSCEILTKERIREAFSVETAVGTVKDGETEIEAVVPYRVIR